MLRTTNISSVPIPFASASGNTFCRAFWCIMWKASMTTSQQPSLSARSSIWCRWSRAPVSVMPRCRSLPFSFLAQQNRNDLPHHVVVGRWRDAVQMKDVDVVGLQPFQRSLEAGDDLGAAAKVPAAAEPGFR